MAPRPHFERREADWLGVAEALDRILDGHAPLPPRTRPLTEALGSTLAVDVHARARLPPHDNSAMDGYAVRSVDLVGASDERPVELEVVGRILAGSAERPPVGPGQACRIMTGAPLPPGADGVTRVEYTDRERGRPGWVRVHTDRDAGSHIRPGGQDMEVGARVAPSGTRIDAGWTAILAAAGHDPVEVRRAPRVVILTTGDELRGPAGFDDVIAGRAIPDSNGPMLAAAVREAGGIPVPVGPARDDAADLRRCLEGAGEADLLLTVGGASMGEGDLLKRVLEDDGLHVDFWRVRMRPGSPVAYGTLPRPGGGARLPLLSLPGNPASAFVTFHLFARPLLRLLAGEPDPWPRALHCRAGDRLTSVGSLCHFHRVRLEAATGSDPCPTACLSGHTGSGLVHSLGPADGLAIVPEGVEAIEVGAAVEVIPLRHGPGGHSPTFLRMP